MKRTILALCALATLVLAGCTTIHNDQQNCTTDCKIGSSEPVYAPVVQVTPSVTYHRYRPHGRSPVVIYHW